MKRVHKNKFYILFYILIITAALLSGCKENADDFSERVIISTPLHIKTPDAYFASASPSYFPGTDAVNTDSPAASFSTPHPSDNIISEPTESTFEALQSAKPSANAATTAVQKPTATVKITASAKPTATAKKADDISPTATPKPAATARPTFNIQIIPTRSKATASNPTTAQNHSQANSPSVNKSFAQEVVVLVNEERAKYNLQPLEMTDDALIRTAELRAEECIQSFSHTRPNGTSCFTAFKEMGVSYKRAGENIAYGFSTPQSVVNGWMNSEGHRANILDTTFTQIGVGCVYYRGTYYWAQSFTG